MAAKAWHAWRALILGVLITTDGAHAGSGGVKLLPVPATAIQPGQVISSADLTQRRFQTTARSLTGIATEISEITGKETRRRLAAGRPIPLSALAEPLAVRRGAKLSATYAETGFSISASVIALEDGPAGSTISVRNIETGQIIRAEVLAGGVLSVNGR